MFLPEVAERNVGTEAGTETRMQRKAGAPMAKKRLVGFARRQGRCSSSEMQENGRHSPGRKGEERNFFAACGDKPLITRDSRKEKEAFRSAFRAPLRSIAPQSSINCTRSHIGGAFWKDNGFDFP
jgi:hypothetical protein